MALNIKEGFEIISLSPFRLPLKSYKKTVHEREIIHGVDDYITKPFGTGELLARIRAALCRAPTAVVNSTAMASVFHTGDLTMSAFLDIYSTFSK